MIVYCATSNRGKLREFQAASSGFCSIEGLPGLREIPICEETGSTFEENAIEKAKYYGAYTPSLLFAEDSGLEVDALGGAPGVYSARYAGSDANDDANNRLLLEQLNGVVHRVARFVCVIALVEGGNLLHTFRGTVEGSILHEPRGEYGFGYDPLFYYGPFTRSFGETSPEQKQSVSHRGNALRQLLEYLKRL